VDFFSTLVSKPSATEGRTYRASKVGDKITITHEVIWPNTRKCSK